MNSEAVEYDGTDPVVAPVVNEPGDVILIVDGDGWFEEEEVGGGVWFDTTGVMPTEEVGITTGDNVPCLGR